MKVFKQARTLPPGVLFRKVCARIVGRVTTHSQARRDAREGTYLSGDRGFVPLELSKVEASEAEGVLLCRLAERYADHQFDLLGSGWVHVPQPKHAAALPPGCSHESERFRALIEGEYAPIDWHLDFKSGHRWSEATWFAHVPYGHVSGVDVKVPWELARLQHVPVLLLAARVADEATAASWRREAVNQLLDFVAANPPRFGVNWRTAMEVGIRAANMALAMDLLTQDGIDGPWRGLLARSLEEHARHIAANLEWSHQTRGNHYLANVAGIAWCAAHLEPSAQTSAWLAWAAQELEVEFGRQFLRDGANFEASVCYHRLSSEMVAWTLACLGSLPGARFERPESGLAPREPRLQPGNHRPKVETWTQRISGMAAFTEWATKPCGLVAQIGDNDSGRFFRLPGEFDGLDEQPLRHDETVDVLRGLCGAAPSTLAGKLAQGLAGVAHGAHRTHKTHKTHKTYEPHGPDESHTVWLFGEGCWEGLETAAFPDFGLFVWRSKRVWMAVRCGSVGQGGVGGHAHNDALHIELVVDGKEWIADPGTGVYTSDPGMRNAYRSAEAHFVPRVAGREPASLHQGLFRLADCGACCHGFGPEGLTGSHDGYGARIWRSLVLLPGGVRVGDLWEGAGALPIPHVDADHPWRPIAFSPGYGRFQP